MRFFWLFLTFFVRIFHGSGESAAEGATRIQKRQLAFFGLPRTAGSIWFDKIYDDVRCDDKPLSKGVIRDSLNPFGDCRQLCIDDNYCVFFAFWRKRNYCETYATCTSQSPDGKAAISVYQRLTECEAEIKHGVKGYVRTMSSSFPDDMVRWNPPNKNFHCQCTTRSWMICVIFISPETPEDKAVRTKLNRQNIPGMKPFFVQPTLIDPSKAPICFDDTAGTGHTKVHAELELAEPSFCIHISFCEGATQDAVCPVRQTPFESGDPVYILRSDKEVIESGKAVKCVSVPGLRQCSMTESSIQNGGFPDPWGREEGKLFLAKRDYYMYWIFDDAAHESGICNRPEFMIQKSSKKKKKKKKRDAEGLESDRSMESGSPPAGAFSSGSPPASVLLTEPPAKSPTAQHQEELIISPQNSEESDEIQELSEEEEDETQNLQLEVNPSDLPPEKSYMRRKSTIRAPNVGEPSDLTDRTPQGTFPTSRKAAYPSSKDISSSDESPRSDDNSEFPRPGSQRMIMGLKGRAELNGKIGLVQEAHPEKGRVELRLPNGEVVLVKPENLIAKGALRAMFAKQTQMQDPGPSPPANPLPPTSPQPFSPPPNIQPDGIQSQQSQSNPSATQFSPDSSAVTQAAPLQEPMPSEPLPRRRPSQPFPKPSPEFYESKKFVSSTKDSAIFSTNIIFIFVVFSLCFLLHLVSKRKEQIYIEFRHELLKTPL